MAVGGLKELRWVGVLADAAKIVCVGFCASVATSALLIEVAREKVLENGADDDPKKRECRYGHPRCPLCNITPELSRVAKQRRLE